MKTNKSNNRSKGSVLIAVIGILAVLSVMALRFNVEMETAMMKTAGKNLASDVKVLANSGFYYGVSKILENGKSFKAPGPAANDHTQLLIEEQMEMLNDVDPALDIMGTGIAEIAERYNSNAFYGGVNSTLSQGYVPDNINLSPGNFNYMIEDLSAKLPIGHVSQWYQRHLISSVLCKLLTGKVPSNSGTKIITELFEDTESPASADSKKYDGSVSVRSLIPYDSAIIANDDHKKSQGLTLADGIIAVEELGSSYTWMKGSVSEMAKSFATDLPRSTKDYRLLSSALTPFARFTHETHFVDGSSAPSAVSYASLNPMVMSRQNNELYKSLFYYDPNDLRLKMYFSVSFPPLSAAVATDDIPGMKQAIANATFFKSNNIGNGGAVDMITSAMPDITISATSSAPGLPFTYNARNDGADTHTIANDPNFLAPDPTILPAPSALVLDKAKSWHDSEFVNVPNPDTAYYVAMDKAAERLERVFKGTGYRSLPADNAMCPIMTRKSLELAIIQAVFGDSILFVVTDVTDTSNLRKRFLYNYEFNTTAGSTSPNRPSSVSYKQIFKALQNNEIKLENIKFVENAFSKFGDALADKYFVPYWSKYDENVKSSDKYQPAAGNALGIHVPAFGLSYDGANYVNYLPHPQTDQRKLDQTYVSLAVAYSVERKGDVASAGALPLLISKLYEVGTVNGASAKINVADINDAFLDLSTNTVVTPMPGSGDKYVALLDVNTAPVNFKPADFTPYETKVRMAVLVNLLNAIIPAKVTPTKNVAAGEENTTLFSTAKAGSFAANLKEFIYFSNGQYKVNDNFEAPSLTGNLPQYLKGWEGGIQTPGMTFWKYGVHSTTFQITVDAFKYDDSARLSSVVTFDMYDDTTPTSVTTEDHTKTKYQLTPAKKALVNSTIYLNPKGRANALSNEFVIGKGEMRYPTDKNTDSWRVLSSVWSSAFGRNGQEINEYFVPILLFPGDVANKGPDGGSWHFVPHPAEPAPFTMFFVDDKGNSYLSGGGSANKNDYSTGALVLRNRSFGAGSWLKWKATFTKGMAANKLDIMLSRNGANANSGYVQDHTITITKISTNQVMCVIPFSTKSDWGYQVNYIKQIPVAVEAGDYNITLTETKDSNPGGYGDEKVFKITIYGN